MADQPAKRPAKKAPAKKATARKPAARKPTAAQQKHAAEQQRALIWAVHYGSPLAVLEGWDPETGTWAANSRVGLMLDRVRLGAHVTTAAKRYNIRKINDLLAKGREYIQDATVSEDRLLVPIEIRPFVDLVAQIDEAESETEMSASEMVYAKIDSDPRIGLSWLSRRFPERWAEHQLLNVRSEFDPRDAAVNELLSDPNIASQMAAFARRAEAVAAGYDDELLQDT